MHVQRNFCNFKVKTSVDDSEKAIDDSVAIVTVVGCATTVTDVINSLKEKH